MSQAKRQMDVRSALTWAFSAECARLDLNDEGLREYARSYGTEYVLIQRMLVGTTIDVSGGHSSPHDDADRISEVVAALPSRLGGKAMAVAMAMHARAGTVPDYMEGARPMLQPVKWRKNALREMVGVTERAGVYVETKRIPHPRNPRKTITRRKHVEIRYTPCTWTPTAQEIESARREYSRWWRALNDVRLRLRAAHLRSVEITDAMPPRAPWGLSPVSADAAN